MGKILLPACLVGVGVGVVVVAVILGFVIVPDIIEGEIEETSQLVNGSDTWSNWELNPVPVYLKFYFFHVNNPLAIENNEIPVLTEIGPYVYSEIRRKTLTLDGIDETAGTITYTQSINYQFEESLSVNAAGEQLSLDDKMNVINLPFLAVATSLFSLKIGPIALWLMDMIVGEGETFVKQNVTVREALFDGWTYPPIISSLLAFTGEQPQFEGGRFGFYRGNEGANDGVYVVNSGVADAQDVGRILTWNGMELLNFWDNPRGIQTSDPKYCNAINGTDGGVFPPFLTTDSSVPIFVTDICRSVALVYEKEEKHRDITGYKFVFDESFYQHPDDNPDNYCFCPSPEPEELENGCAQGIIRLTSCREGAPVVSSTPHFYNGDPDYMSRVDGLVPNKDLHETAILIQPDTGLPLRIRKRIQINLEVQNFQNEFHENFNGISHIIFPALWASEEMDLDEELADEMKSRLLTPMRIVDITKWVVMGLGILLVLAGIAVFIKRR